MASNLQYHGPKPVTTKDFKMAHSHLSSTLLLNNQKIKDHQQAKQQALQTGNPKSASYNQTHLDGHLKDNARIQQSLKTLTKLGGNMADVKKTGSFKGEPNTLGGGGRFKQMTAQGMSPGLVAYIGRKKYGASRMSKMAAAGKKG